METLGDIREREEKLLCRGYGRYPIAITRGSGSHLWDVNGKEYIDLLTGIGVVALGHCNPELIRALDDQAGILWHVSNLFYQIPQLDLAEKLLSTTHHGKAFFCNSGAEANEACIKLARRYMRMVKKREAYEIITVTDAFHGRTLATLAATGRKALQQGFEPMPEGFTQVQAGDLDALARAISGKTAAVLLECVQGEAGVELLPWDYLESVQTLCREKDILFMCDEVQCGLCRTGKFWAFQNADLRPDAISCAKALANGLPMGAMLATDEVALGFETGSHATTFGGGALTSAVAAKVIEIMLGENLAERASRVGAGLKKRLLELQERLPAMISEVRGIGLMIGLEIGEPAMRVWAKLLEKGFITNLNHNKALRLLPPLNIPEEELAAFVDALGGILEEEERARSGK